MTTKEISEGWRPWQLKLFGSELELKPKDGVWAELLEDYSSLNALVNRLMIEKGLVPDGVQLVYLTNQLDSLHLCLKSELWTEESTPARYGEPVAQHCLITNTQLYPRIFGLIAGLWEIRNLDEAFSGLYATREGVVNGYGNTKILRRLPERIVHLEEGYEDSVLHDMFAKKAELTKASRIVQETDPRFYGPHTVPREWWTIDETLFVWLGPQDRMVIDPTVELAGLIGMANSPESFDVALCSLKEVWNTKVNKGRFLFEGEFWFGRALQYNLLQYLDREIKMLNKWSTIPDFDSQFEVNNSGTEVDEVLSLTRRYHRRDSYQRPGEYQIPNHKLGYAQQLASRKGIQMAITRLETFKKRAEQISELFT